MPPASPPRPRPRSAVVILRLGSGLAAFVFFFVLALDLIKAGASPVKDFIERSTSFNLAESLGFGWLLACLVMSGSPIAALALSLLDAAALTATQAFAMVTGSRLGASFFILLIGFVYDLRARQRAGGVYVGATAFLTTFTIYLPAFAIGELILAAGWLDNVRFGVPEQLGSMLTLVVKPIVTPLRDSLHPVALFFLGVATLVGSFQLFDCFLPPVDPTGGNLKHMGTTIFRPWIPFVFGMVITCFTLSVSVSIGLLVPFTVRGLVRRENLVPYIIGANITTFVDTLFASLLMKSDECFLVILCQIIVVTLVSLPIVFLCYRPYERLIDGLARTIIGRRLYMVVFVSALLIVPLCLLLIA